LTAVIGDPYVFGTKHCGRNAKPWREPVCIRNGLAPPPDVHARLRLLANFCMRSEGAVLSAPGSNWPNNAAQRAIRPKNRFHALAAGWRHTKKAIMGTLKNEPKTPVNMGSALEQAPVASQKNTKQTRYSMIFFQEFERLARAAEVVAGDFCRSAGAMSPPSAQSKVNESPE
ncbi:MAG: hypothetical protein JWM47_4459, partial [Acidimicrobiales bacterium]|nr:hypothetical protein [Acidimicrobiales bacterium]